MSKLLDRAAVLAGTFVTYVLAAAVGVTAAADEIASAAPDGGETAVAWLVRVASWLAAAVAVVRQVTPVDKDQRGLLPPS